MSQLFGRRLLLSMSIADPSNAFEETIRLSTEPLPRRITFKGTKTWKPAPNTCEIEVYNLSPELRAAVMHAKTPTLKLAAGYGADNNLTQIFYGQTIYAKHEIKANSADIITTISTTDGGEKKQQARIHVSFGPGTSTSVVLRRIVQELGIKPGNIDLAAKEIDKGILSNLYASGITISGSAAEELGHVCRSVGYDYSIQDGALQMLKLGTARDQFAIVLNADSGLVNSPTIDNKGVVTGQCLLFKAGAGLDLTPGRLIKIESEFLSGQYILARCEFSGDNYSEDWYCNFEAVAKKSDLAKVK